MKKKGQTPAIPLAAIVAGRENAPSLAFSSMAIGLTIIILLNHKITNGELGGWIQHFYLSGGWLILFGLLSIIAFLTISLIQHIIYKKGE